MSSTPVLSLEIGSLTTSSREECQFIGSSSGVFFVNTVHRAFARSKKVGVLESDNEGAPSAHEAASVENFIAGNESPRYSQSMDQSECPLYQGFRPLGKQEHVLGVPPNQESATALIMVYFQTWHPLFPFLHGPTFLRDVEAFYAGTPNLQHQTDRQQICFIVVLQCVFNIAALDKPDLNIPEMSRIKSSSSLLSLLGIIASKHDILGLQALLALQLYLITTMSLRSASTIGGVLFKLLFHGGFHRCPFRYAQISQHNCDLRKRIFWSAYVADRYLSQALGHPLGVQDSDIDVCIPGTEERHQHVPRATIWDGSGEARAHLPKEHPDSLQAPSDPGGEENSTKRTARSKKSPPGEDVLCNYVRYYQITGRALELFHKSLHNRLVDHHHITLLTSEVHSWWNNLPQHLQEHTPNDESKGFSALFNLLYQSLIILINRPFLSLIPSTPEFRLSLQTCAGASRQMILILRDHAAAFSLPGILSGTWMAGLVLAFGCELDLYPFAKGISEIEICLSLLQRMSDRYSTAGHCHAVLGILLKDLHTQFNNDSKIHQSLVDDDHLQKRRRVDDWSSNLESQPETSITNPSPPSAPNRPSLAMTPEKNTQLTPPNLGYQQSIPAVPWQDPMMSGEVGDVLAQVSWEALFQGDETGWEEWKLDGV